MTLGSIIRRLEKMEERKKRRENLLRSIEDKYGDNPMKWIERRLRF